MSNKLLDYGIAVNFFGNYAREGAQLSSMTDRIFNSLSNLQQLVIGGGITAGLYKLSSSILNTAKTMEQNFANLKSILGSTTKAMETLDWARKKGASTPFEIGEVNDAVGTMTTMGFNKNDKMREEVFNSVGDFASLKGFNFADMMQRVSKASFGNWESLGDQFGIRKQSIGTMAREQMSRTPDKFKGEEAGIAKAIQMVEKGKQGTEEYKMAIVKLIGVLGSGGMVNRLNTIAGSMSNISDITTNFMMSMVGYTQQAGTLANVINKTLVDNILSPFMKTHQVVINGVMQTVSATDQLGRIGKGVGSVLIGMWGGVSDALGGATSTIIQYIDKMDAFFSDYKNNIAPLILFLFLVRLEVELFLKGFMDGFGTTFKWFLGAIKFIYQAIGTFVGWLGTSEESSRNLGKVVGWVVGLMLGMKVFSFAMSPFQPLITSVVSLYGHLTKVVGMISMGKGWSLADSVLFRWWTFKQTINNIATAVWKAMVATGQFIAKIAVQGYTMLATGISSALTYATAIGVAVWGALVSATVAVWSFTVALLANPITQIVIAVIALVAGLVWLALNWDKVTIAFKRAWEFTVTGLGIMWEWVKSVGGRIGDFFSNMWGKVANSFRTAFSGIKDFFIGLWGNIEAWFMDKIATLVGFFTDAWGGVKDFFGVDSDPVNSPQPAGVPAVPNPKIFETRKPNAGGSTTTNTKEADTKNNYDGAVFQINGVQNPKGLFEELKNHAQNNGK